MTDTGVLQVLTGNGLGIKIEDMVGISRTDFSTLNGLFDIHAKADTFDAVKSKLVVTRIENKLGAIEGFVSKGS